MGPEFADKLICIYFKVTYLSICDFMVAFLNFSGSVEDNRTL